MKSGCSKLTLLNVLVDNGVVTFWGFVDCEDTRETLRAMAANMAGVNEVEANMGISTMLDL